MTQTTINLATYGNLSETQCKSATWSYYIALGYNRTSKSVLHHIDPTLKHRDPERYHKWLVCDVQPMTIQDHRRLHMRMEQRQRTRTKEHNDKISQSLSTSTTRGKRIQIIRKSIDIRVFDNLQQAADYIGVSRQLLSQCLRPNTKNRKAKGYEIRILGAE